MRRWAGDGAHGFYLGVMRVELLECAAADEVSAVPRGPEGNFWSTELFEGERVDAFRRGVFVHGGKMLPNECDDLRVVEGVDANIHLV